MRECGDILGVTTSVENSDDPKAILHYIFQEIIKYKSANFTWSGSEDSYELVSWCFFGTSGLGQQIRRQKEKDIFDEDIKQQIIRNQKEKHVAEEDDNDYDEADEE